MNQPDLSNHTQSIKIIGLMSGTSLDGLDICLVKFNYDGQQWDYKILETGSEDFPPALKERLSLAQGMTALEYVYLDNDYGHFIGKAVKAFMDRTGATPDAIASHGQTIFHQPENGMTSQIGSGAAIAAETGVDCICDFRTVDVALGGQGAPLVPIGDRTLFANYDACLNLGGFSNISYEGNARERVAFDICPVNYVLNYYTRKVGLEYDKDGLIARRGKISEKLLSRLNHLPFYIQTGPKSLGREWVEQEVFPMIDSENLPLEDILATFCEHVADQIALKAPKGNILVTGGGALNIYLIERMSAKTSHCRYVVPNKRTVNFKEALIFALLGAMYLFNIPSCLKSVTGARYDNIGGCLYKAVAQRQQT